MANSPGRPWLTVAQVAAQTGIPVTTVRYHCRVETGLLYRWARKRDTPIGETYFIPPARVADFADQMKSRRRES